VSLTADPRLLPRFDPDAGQWRIAEGTYTVAFGKNAENLVLEANVPMTERRFGH
jgi:beta-glucosidase